MALSGNCRLCRLLAAASLWSLVYLRTTIVLVSPPPQAEGAGALYRGFVSWYGEAAVSAALLSIANGTAEAPVRYFAMMSPSCLRSLSNDDVGLG